MSQTITIYPEHSKEYQRLKAAAEVLSAFTDKTCIVKTVYFDVGQNWSWTTILVEDNNSPFGFYQLLFPCDQETIVTGNYDDYMKCIENLIEKINRRP